jgi:hypothetical protein
MANDHIADTIILSLDFDGVLGQGLPVKIKYAKAWFGLDLALDQTKRKGFEDLVRSLGRSDLTYRMLMDRINAEHSMEYQIPPGCRETLTSLHAEGFRFVVITSREDNEFPPAMAFLKKNYSGLIHNVHNTRNEPKGRFVDRLKPRLHMDDDLSKLVSIHDYPVELAYYRQPENAHQNLQGSHQRIVEMRTWSEFHSYCIFMRSMHEAICWKYGMKNRYSNIREMFGLKQNLNEDQQAALLREYSSHT